MGYLFGKPEIYEQVLFKLVIDYLHALENRFFFKLGNSEELLCLQMNLFVFYM